MSAIRTEAFTFEPALHSLPELRFLLDHLEEPPNAALFGTIPAGVNPAQIEKTLKVFQELHQLESYRKVPWAGFDAIKDAILRFLSWEDTRQNIYRVSGGPQGQNAIPQASQYAFSEDGSAFKYAIGADSGEMARTEILDDGSRRSFSVRLLEADGAALSDALSTVAPWIKRTKAAMTTTKDEVLIDKKGKHGTVKCSICDKTEEFLSANRQQFMAARSRMARHLKHAKDDVARHRLLYRKVFESRDAKV